MHIFSDFQSIFQLSIAIHLVAEWANLSPVKDKQTLRLRRCMRMRLLRVKKYVDELKEIDIWSSDNDVLYENEPDLLKMELVKSVFKMLLHAVFIYSIILLIIASYFANVPLKTLWAIILVIPVFVPGLYFVDIIRRYYKFASKEQEQLLVSLIANAEIALKEYQDTHTYPSLIELIKRKGKITPEEIKKYGEAKTKYNTDKDDYISRRIIELETPDRK